MTKQIRSNLIVAVGIIIAAGVAIGGWYWWSYQTSTPATPSPVVYQVGGINWTLPAGWQVAATPIAKNIRGQAVTDATGQRVAVLYCPALTAQGDKFWQFTVEQRTYDQAGKSYNVSWYEGLPTEEGKANDATPYTTHINVNGPEATDSCTLIAVGNPWSASQDEKRAVFESIFQQVQ